MVHVVVLLLQSAHLLMSAYLSFAHCFVMFFFLFVSMFVHISVLCVESSSCFIYSCGRFAFHFFELYLLLRLNCSKQYSMYLCVWYEATQCYCVNLVSVINRCFVKCLQRFYSGLEVGWYETIWHTGTSGVTSKPYCHSVSE